MGNILSLVGLLLIVFGALGMADGAFSATPMVGVASGAFIAFSGATTYLLAEIVTVLKIKA